MSDSDPLSRSDRGDDAYPRDDADEEELVDEAEVPADIPPSLIELEKIPRRLWEQTMAPLRRQQRYWIAQRVTDERLRDVAGTLAFELDMAEGRASNARDEARFDARRTAVPLPTPDAEHPTRRSTVQINVRLRADDHARLSQAAALAGLKPTTLARALMLNGVAMILRAHATPDGAHVQGRALPSV